MKMLHLLKTKLTVDTAFVSQLAQERGCILRIILGEDMPLYWIENQYFIGKPFRSLEDLASFIQRLPLME